MEFTKKKWERPQLIILARGMPEENVLTSCKTEHIVGTSGPGGVYTQSNCGTAESTTNCGACQSRGNTGS